ncbi:acetylornithine carbamoyltransferase [Pontibacter sp. 13R65]|uniref:acetylornithine carbamoyltransferase n=1 Tax=Pontibacter sp. 13R65 TaxID=3127458 RepID=UPI00301CD551
MKNYTSVHDVADVAALVKEALEMKKAPLAHKELGTGKTLGLIFLNPSLRTRLSTQKAALNLGLNVMVMNLDKEGWALETQEGVVMNGTTVEHIKEAAAVMGQYCDILGLRSFPKLQSKEEDYSEDILNKFIKYTGVPILSLESATRHPLQSLADLVTITEHKPEGRRPKVVLTWAPHVKPLPQAVPNSFAEWMCAADVDFVITHPEGYELENSFTEGATIEYDQEKALQDADFIYVKNWSSYKEYGKILSDGEGWMMTNEKLINTNNAKVMHCLPVRRGLELSDEILDGPNSLVIQEAGNRVYAAQAVLKQLLENSK